MRDISEQIKELRTFGAMSVLDMIEPEILRKQLNDAADTIESLSAKLQSANMERSTAYYNGGWIPCNNGENLPNEAENDIKNGWSKEVRPSNYVLCESKDGNIFKGFYSYVDKTWTDFLEKTGYETDEIIRWRELAEPYKQE